jgi:hypothetical protein
MRKKTPNHAIERTGQQRCCWLPSRLRRSAAAHGDRSALRGSQRGPPMW